MSRSALCAVALAFGATLTLQGCGSSDGGGGGSGPSGSDTTTVTTTTTPGVGPGGLRYCEDVDTFYKITYDETGQQKSASGQCLPSKVPGAYYTSPGEKGDDGKSDRSWMCFSPGFEKSLWTDKAAKENDPPFTGACEFRDYGSTVTPEQVDHCSQHLDHHPSVCAPGPSMFWGACWSSHSENWKCIPRGDPTIDGLAKGDCKASVLLEDLSSAPTKYFYDGVCHFSQERQTVYKCDTVSVYDIGNGGTCGQNVDKKSDKACFSLKSGISWTCTEGGKTIDTPCDWTLLPDGSKDYYKGYCVFPQNDEYTKAVDAHNLTTTRVKNMVV